MLLGRGYCEVLHVSRTPFLALLRKFPALESTLNDVNQKRKEHAALLMGGDSSVGDWIRPYRSGRRLPTIAETYVYSNSKLEQILFLTFCYNFVQLFENDFLKKSTIFVLKFQESSESRIF